MNKVLNNKRKVKISRYYIDLIVENFIYNISAKDVSLNIKLNIKTINRYYQEIRRVIYESEKRRFENIITEKNLVLKIVFSDIYDNDRVDEHMTFYLYVIHDKYIYIQEEDLELKQDNATIAYFVIKEDCYADKYLNDLKTKISESGYYYLKILCSKLCKQVQFYKHTLLHHLTTESFMVNVYSDKSTLDLQYMKNIFRETPLFKK